ncbi:MAG: hypothetical protein V4492_04800 [Chlamydiota bacterium]
MQKYLKTMLFFFVFLFELPRLFSIQGESSYPYMSGYTWAFFCDWRLLDQDYASPPEGFDPRLVKRGDILFVSFSSLDTFAREYLPLIEDKVILVTSNYGFDADSAMPGPHAYLLDEDKIAAWFVQNIDREPTSKLFPIPIGLGSKHWPHGNTNLLDAWIPIALAKTEKPNLWYLNFRRCPERVDCVDYFTQIGAHFDVEKPFQDYLHDLSETRFVISPPGHGVDCHRTWEALLMGAYPVVKRSTLDPLFEDLPVVIIDQWEEVTDEFLLSKQAEFDSKTWSREKLYSPYWFNQVRVIQEQLRNQ